MDNLTNRFALWLDRHYLPASVALWLAVLLLLSMLGLIATRAHAADLTGTFTLPTQNTDGTTIGTTDAITQVRVEYSLCSGTSAFGTKIAEVVVPAPGTSYTFPGVNFGKFCIRAYAKNALGIESAATPVVVRDYQAPTPKPPVLGAVSVLVFETRIHPTQGLVAGRQVGTVELGTKCFADELGQPIAGSDLYRVRFSDVTLDKAPKSELLVAKCAAS
jgi:hypothetical protein